MSHRHKRAYVHRGNTRHRIVPVWKDKFDQGEFARILLLLAIHLDETETAVHNKGQKSGTDKSDGGGHHE